MPQTFCADIYELLDGEWSYMFLVLVWLVAVKNFNSMINRD